VAFFQHEITKIQKNYEVISKDVFSLNKQLMFGNVDNIK